VGAWSPSLDGDLDLMTGESDGLVLLVPRVHGGRVFQGTQLDTLIHESPGNLV